MLSVDQMQSDAAVIHSHQKQTSAPVMQLMETLERTGPATRPGGDCWGQSQEFCMFNLDFLTSKELKRHQNWQLLCEFVNIT